MSLEEMINKGGPVVLILLGYSLIAAAIVFERLLYFALLTRPSKDFSTQLTEALADDRGARMCEGLRGPEVAVVCGMMSAISAGVKDLNQVAIRLGSDELQRMERGFRTLGILGNTAPLLGLLGTITGLMKAFQTIEQAGGKVDAQALAGGIWEAMITTCVGLAVAIPVVLLLHMLEGLADRRTRSIRYHASLVLERWQDPGSHEVDDEEITAPQEVLTNAL